jgi:hypothetical protein
MGNPEKDTLLEAYASKILGIRNYRSAKQEFFVADFLNVEVLEPFLQEVLDCESDMTPAGKSFIEKYYGFENLAERLALRGVFAPTEGPSPSQEICEWLRDLEPMATIRFIEEGRGRIRPNASVRDDLLPPDC